MKGGRCNGNFSAPGKLWLVPAIALVILSSPGTLAAQVSSRIETIKAGVFNLIGVELTEPLSAEGTFASVTGKQVTDSAANFSETLAEPGKTWILQVTSGESDGLVAEVASVEGNALLTMVDDLGTARVAKGDSYEIRAAKTISSIFGANNEAGLKSGFAQDADLIWISNGEGGFSIYYAQNNFLGRTWAGLGGESAKDVPIFYTEAFFVQRRGDTDLELAITGHIQTRPAIVALRQGFNFISRIVPVGQTFRTSNLIDQVGGRASSGDIFWNPDGQGGYTLYAVDDLFTNREWFSLNGDYAADVPWASGLIIQRSQEASRIKIGVPEFYKDL